MAANTAPIFSLSPKIGFGGADSNGGTTGPLKTANTALDGTGTILTVYTAGSCGSFVQKLRFRPAGRTSLPWSAYSSTTDQRKRQRRTTSVRRNDAASYDCRSGLCSADL